MRWSAPLLLAACGVAAGLGLPAAPRRMKGARGTAVRGGATMAVGASVAAALQSGVCGVPVLAGVAAVVLTPLTMYRQAYSFSVGYGASVASMAVVLGVTFPGRCSTVGGQLALATGLYGFRLAGYLLKRQLDVPDIAERLRAFDKTPYLKRLPLIASVAIFYAMMCSPVLYALRSPVPPGTVQHAVAVAGCACAYAGAAIEAVADQQKSMLKATAIATSAPGTFHGPSGGVYSKCRHPNYAGEVLFWFGLFLGGVPSFGWQVLPYVTGTLGLFGITSIMLSATKRLDAKQADKYGGQPSFEVWKKKTGALLPKLL
ncbi:hypothetical protein M885DRAFT_507757 [Pelagophyceae sp. CCMP2097]|nr:hypothetical protein M885DRAFT_507757 [Pelagophyceae sp. CCMP2097]